VHTSHSVDKGCSSAILDLVEAKLANSAALARQMNPPLYRTAALQAKHTNWLGDIVLIRPMAFSVLTGFAVLLALLVLLFLSLGTYTKRSTVSGQLVPSTGLVKVYAAQPGVVLKRYVAEDQFVNQGDLLFELSSERQSSTQGDTQIAISRQVEARQESLREELAKTQFLQQDEHKALVKKIASLKAELHKLASQIDVQKGRVVLAEDATARARDLLAKNYISKEQLQLKQADLLDQRGRLQTFERDSISVGRELASQQSDLSSLALKQQNQLAQIDRMLASTSQELTESEAKRRLLVTAPQAGVATAVTAEVGQGIDIAKPLVSMVPAGAVLQAQLYAPSKAVGFIKPGDTVLVRYQAYPYQKFGHAKGVVASVSKTALPVNELGNMGNIFASGASGNSEALYRITVNLEKQMVNAYGKQHPLQAAMLLDADVLQETRRLYEWVLEPLYSLTGKL